MNSFAGRRQRIRWKWRCLRESSLRPPPALTEQRNPRSENLEKLSARELVELFVEEEKFVQDALRGAIVDLTRAIEIVTESLRNGGRLFYVGAGSSGRIG